MNMTITKDDIKQYITDNLIIDVNLESSDPPKATIKLTLPGLLSIKGFTLRESKFEHKKLGDWVWIQPPSIRRNDGKFMETVFFEDKELWDIVEKIIYDAYKKVSGGNNND